MRKFGLVSCSFLYTLSTFLMFGKQEVLKKEAGVVLLLSGILFVAIDYFLGYLQKGSWLDRYGSYQNYVKMVIFLICLPFLLMELVLLSFGSSFMISITTLTYTPVVLIAGVLLGTSLVFAGLKEDRLLSFSALLGWLFLIGFVFLFAVGIQMPHHQILPFQSFTYKSLNEGIWFYIFSLFIHIAVLISFTKKDDRNYVRYGVLIASVVYCLVYMGVMYIIDYRMLEKFHFPTITSASIMSYGNFLQRLELVGVFGIIVCDLVKLAVLFRFLYRLVRVLLSQQWTRLFVVGVGVVVLLVGVVWYPSYDAWLLLSNTILYVFGGGCLVLWLLS